jgi:hypothetical protein
MSYKIRINCTNKKELCFNGEKINKELYYDINNKLLPMYIDYIDKIAILHKTTNSFTTAKSFTIKTLEIICNREIDEMEFNEFIIILKSAGFYCEIDETKNKQSGSKIQFIKSTEPSNPIFYYDFTTQWPVRQNPRKRKQPRLNASKPKYSSQMLYI